MVRFERFKNHMKGLKIQFHLAKFEFNSFTGLRVIAKYVAVSKISNFSQLKQNFFGFLHNFYISFDSPHQPLSNRACNVNKFGVCYILPYTIYRFLQNWIPSIRLIKIIYYNVQPIWSAIDRESMTRLKNLHVTLHALWVNNPAMGKNRLDT